MRTGRPPKPFWDFVEKSDGCWLWKGTRNPEGYGMFVRTVHGRPRYFMAHRWAYVLEHGGIPAGLVIDHLCRVTSCVRPDHLEAVTQQVNSIRGNGRAGINARKTHCANGHPLVSMYPKPGRGCPPCYRAKDIEYKRRKRREGRPPVGTGSVLAGERLEGAA